jgi:hypothetical protein
VADFFRRRAKKPASQPGLLDLWFARNEDETAVWDGLSEGPSVEEVGTRLSSVPQVFLDERVDLTALAGDVLAIESESGIPALAAAVTVTGSSVARRAAAIALWLWASEDEIGPFSTPLRRQYLDRTIAALAFRLAPVVDPTQWISDAERRDEAVRTFLLWSGQRPAGETDDAARAMLAMRDSLQHSRALAEALRDHQHRLEVTKRLQAAQAKEAAARYSSE